MSYGVIQVSEAKRLRQREQENARLKKRLTEAEPDKAALRELLASASLESSTSCLASPPARIACDNGPEFTSKAMFFWSWHSGVKLRFIQSGKPTQHAFIESFNGKFREYCLDLNWSASLDDATATIEDWRRHYNHVRPHRSLGSKPPAVFASEAA